jgi:Sec-independent protein translocase protein TatA
MGFTSFLVGVGAVIVVVGPKDLPIVARKLGYAVGRSVAFLRSARRVAREVSKDPEVAQMVAQVEKGVADIQTIRAGEQWLLLNECFFSFDKQKRARNSVFAVSACDSLHSCK